MEISISGLGSVNINGVEYGSNVNTGGTNYSNVNTGDTIKRHVDTGGGIERDADTGGTRDGSTGHPNFRRGSEYWNDLDINDPNIPVDVVGVGQCRLIFHGDIGDSYKNTMVRCFNAARQHMEGRGMGWLMAVDVRVKHSNHGWGGYYDPNTDQVWVMPTGGEQHLIHAIIHEFGHRFEHRFPSCRTDLNERYQWCLYNDPTAFPRDYSRTNFGEFWADCFASWTLGTHLKPHLLEWVEHIIKTYKR